MNDVQVWELLARGDPSPPELLQALSSLSSEPLEQRMPFLGLVQALLEAPHPDPEVRALAAQVLAGADGLLGLRRLGAALRDDEQQVRAAAVAAWAHSTRRDPARWAQLVFNPHADVRRLALEAAPTPAHDVFALHLLGDPELCPRLLLRLESLELNASALPLILGWARRGRIREEHAQACARQITLSQLSDMAQGAAALLPASASLSAAAAALRAGDAEPLRALLPPPVLDVLDLLALLWNDARAKAQISTLALGLGRAAAPEAAVWIVVAAGLGRAWNLAAAQACARVWTLFLCLEWIPLDVRKQATRCFQGSPSTLKPADLEPALSCDPLVRRSDGLLDLSVLGNLLRGLRQPKSAFGVVKARWSTGVVLEAMRADLEAAALFLAVPNARPQALVDAILASLDSRGRAGLAVALARLLSVNRLATLSSLAPEERVATVLGLVEGGGGLSSKRCGRLVEALAPRSASPQSAEWLERVLGSESAAQHELVLELVGHLARGLAPSGFGDVAVSLTRSTLARLVACVEAGAGVPARHQDELVARLRDASEPELRAWADARAGLDAPAPAFQRLAHSPLGEGEFEEIRSCAPEVLDEVLGGLGRPVSGLCAALGARSAPQPSLRACAALLVCEDRPEQVNEQFARYSQDTNAFAEGLDRLMVRDWRRPDLPLLGHAWLYRWDPHFLAFGGCVREAGGFHSVLQWANGSLVPALAKRVWGASERLFARWSRHEAEALDPVASVGFVRFLCTQLSLAPGRYAASMLGALARSSIGAPLIDDVRELIVARLNLLPEAVQTELGFWLGVRATGGIGTGRAPTWVPHPTIDAIRASDDRETLLAWARDSHPLIVQEASLRLVELGGEGEAALLALILAEPDAANAPSWAGALALCSDAFAEQVERAGLDSSLPSAVRFSLLLRAQEDHGRHGEVLIALVAAEAPQWFEEQHWDSLLRVGLDVRALALGCAESSQSVAYVLAVGYLLGVHDEETLAALRRFLFAGPSRQQALRVRVANHLAAHGDLCGFPIQIAALAGERDPGADLPARLPDWEGHQAILAGLASGREVVCEILLNRVDLRRLPQGLFQQIMADASGPLRGRLLQRFRRLFPRSPLVDHVVQTFAWGVRVGRELTGRRFRVRMHAGDELGFTRLGTSTIHVSPLPILRGERDATRVVEGLILHEYGHHLYNTGPGSEAIHARAQKRRLSGLLNLVEDEHLERNLRARERDWGDRFKTLAAYAFQHVARAVSVDVLLRSLRDRAFEVLICCELRPTRHPMWIEVDNGAVLSALEKSGSSMARFMRALRMGQGDRFDDPRVRAGLALFKGKRFRQADLDRLYEITEELRRIFGDETELLEGFGFHSSLEGDGEELVVRTNGTSDEELQAEIDEALHRSDKGKGGRPIRTINVGREEEFTTISRVMTVAHDPSAHALYAREVARDARRMRRFFLELGLASVPERARLRGTRLDTTRLNALVVRRDPRVLVARKVVRATDLFLGLVVDCSGSMTINERIETAKRFATLLAEAARGCAGIDVRIFGFTDSLIYDAGDAKRCAAHALKAGGGNNDAAALWHASRVATASRRKAKLLVMISDGSPTECTTTALKNLVARLSKQGICSAQIAVAPIEERCFEHYVEVADVDPADAVRNFGRVITGLVRRVLKA